MKLAAMPDIHLNKSSYKGVMDKKLTMLPFRNVDFMNAFEDGVDKCINEFHPDLVVIPGDIYENPTPSNEIRGFLSEQISRLSEAKIPIIIMIGNHDVCKKHHGLKDLQGLKLKNVIVVDKPWSVNFKGTQLFFFPYSLEVEQKKKTIKEDFQDFVRVVQSSKKSDMPSIFFGHFGVRGATLNQYAVEEVDTELVIDSLDTMTDTTTTLIPVETEKVQVSKDYRNRNPKDIDCNDLDSIGVDYVILGDYHKHQVLDTKKCIAMYPGSLEKTSFTEVDQKKGFILYDSEAKSEGKLGKCRFVEYTHCRPMKELKGNLAAIQKTFREMDYSQYQGAIIKIRFIGTHNEHIDFSTALEGLKRDIRNKVNPVHVYSLSETIDQQMNDEATKLEKEIMDKGHLSNDDIIQVVKEIAMEQITDEKEKGLTIDLADEIYKETVGE